MFCFRAGFFYIGIYFNFYADMVITNRAINIMITVSLSSVRYNN